MTAIEIQSRDKNRYELLKKKRQIETIIMWQLDYNKETFNAFEYITTILKINVNE
jgi:hypothetical protein